MGHGRIVGSVQAQEAGIAVKLHRCRFEWLKRGPCWKVEKALKDMGIDYELAPGPSRPSKRDEMIEHTGHDEIDHIFHAFGFSVETGARGQDNDAEF